MSRQDILGQRLGWGDQATGGLVGPEVAVTTNADSGQGSLRAALEAEGPAWVTFAQPLTITLERPIRMRSNKTVDARLPAGSPPVTIKGEGHQVTGFDIVGASNLIFISLNLDDGWTNWGQDSEGADGMRIQNAADIWVHHCRFAQWRDGAIDMKGGVSRFTMSYCKVEKTYQALNWDGDLLTFCYSRVDRVAARAVQILTGRCHSANNFISNWKLASIQNAKYGGKLLSEKSIWLPGTYNQVNTRDTSSRITNEKHQQLKPVNFVGGNNYSDATFAFQSRAKLIVVPAGPELKAMIEAKAGPVPL